MLTTVLEAPAGDFALSAQERSTNASGDDMEETRLAVINDMAAWIVHDDIVASHVHSAYENSPEFIQEISQKMSVLKRSPQVIFRSSNR